MPFYEEMLESYSGVPEGVGVETCNWYYFNRGVGVGQLFGQRSRKRLFSADHISLQSVYTPLYSRFIYNDIVTSKVKWLARRKKFDYYKSFYTPLKRANPRDRARTIYTWRQKFKRSKLLLARLSRRHRAVRQTHQFQFFLLAFCGRFLQSQTILLYQSLFKWVCSSHAFKQEHRILMKQCKYMFKLHWSFDFIFFANYAVTFANFDFFLVHLLYSVKLNFKQTPASTILFYVLNLFYVLRYNIRGIRLLASGPVDRHGRTRQVNFKVGDVGVISYSAFVIYDAIQWVTYYGAITLKLWIHYIR